MGCFDCANAARDISSAAGNDKPGRQRERFIGFLLHIVCGSLAAMEARPRRDLYAISVRFAEVPSAVNQQRNCHFVQCPVFKALALLAALRR